MTSHRTKHSSIHFCYGQNITFVKSKKKILSIDTRKKKNIFRDSHMSFRDTISQKN